MFPEIVLAQALQQFILSGQLAEELNNVVIGGEEKPNEQVSTEKANAVAENENAVAELTALIAVDAGESNATLASVDKCATAIKPRSKRLFIASVGPH